MSSYAYYNGKFGKKEDISIPLSDRSIFFGDAVYDAAIGSYDRILWENEHIDRFLSNAEKIGIQHNYTKAYISSLLREIAVKSMLKSYFLYFQMSRSLKARTHSPKDSEASLLVTIDPIEVLPSPPPLKLITVDDKRYEYCDIKTVNLLPAVLSAIKADESHCDEAIFVKNNIVTECLKSNISILNQGRIITHPKNNRILPGVAREHLILISRRLGVPVEERPFTIEELFSADEILVTSTTKLCRKASEINGIKVGNKHPSLANRLCELMYFEFVDFCKI